MNGTTTGLAGIIERFTARRQQTADRRRIEGELAGFTTESEKAELSAILHRSADAADADSYDVISDRVVATTEYTAA